MQTLKKITNEVYRNILDQIGHPVDLFSTKVIKRRSNFFYETGSLKFFVGNQILSFLIDQKDKELRNLTLVVAFLICHIVAFVVGYSLGGLIIQIVNQYIEATS